MSVFNEKPFWLCQSIESILNQTYKNFEFIIILDDPKRNDLFDLIESFKKKDKRIKFFVNKENRGLVYSLNKAIKISKGNFIARMDADDISHPNRIYHQLNFLNNYNLDLIGCNVNLFKGENDIFFTTDKLQSHKYLTKILKFGFIGIVHPTFFGKKKVFNSLYYSNSPHTEDLEFLVRVVINNFKIGNTDKVLLDCRYSDKSITKTQSYYISEMVKYISFRYSEFLRTGNYSFDNSFFKKIKPSSLSLKTHHQKQLHLSNFRIYLSRKKKIFAAYSLIRALFISKDVLKFNIFINIIVFLFRKAEMLELKFKNI